MLLFLSCNLILIFFVYMVVTSGVLRSVKPVIQGIEALPAERDVYVKEKGLLSDLAVSINKAAEKLRNQDYQLQKRRLPVQTGLPEYPMISERRSLWFWDMQARLRRTGICRKGSERKHGSSGSKACG